MLFKSVCPPLAIASLIVVVAMTLTACGGASTPTAATVPATTQPATPVSTAPAAPATPAGQSIKKIDVNAASAADFLTIPGVGSQMVREFQEYRPYASIQQFRREIGKYVNAQQVAEYEKYLYVPISANNSDAATLQQIPGLDDREVQVVIAGRPYASNDAFFASLAQYVTPADLDIAKTFVR